jgi:medium-chain acyl-[acyl-carrier-protein] hydrolase
LATLHQQNDRLFTRQAMRSDHMFAQNSRGSTLIATNTNPWIAYPSPEEEVKLRLFCFPYAGGGASVYRLWKDELSSILQICPIQLPGRENRLKEPCFTRLEPLLQDLAQALLPYLDVPYAFFGHSLGALISFEVARTLIQNNEPGPIHMFISARHAPQVPDPYPPLHHLSEVELIEKLREMGGTSAEVLQNEELMKLVLPIIRADFAINETYAYTPGPLLDCPISAYGGMRDSLVSRDNLAAWRDQTHNIFTLRVFPGDHFFLQSARQLLLGAIVHDLAQSLRRIDQAL